MGERRGVIVGIDGSEGSRAALAFALRDAARRGTGVRVISVFLPSQFWPEAYWLAPPPAVVAVKDDLRGMAMQMLDAIVTEQPVLAAVPVELHELEGHPARVLIEQAKGADLLVVGHRGRGGFASALLGSVGLHCVLHGECPVTVVRPELRLATSRDGLAHAAQPARLGVGPIVAPTF